MPPTTRRPTLLALATTLAVGVGLLAAAPVGAAPGGGPRCTIVGTPGDDRLVGTPGDDVICGLGGDDRIYGRGGNDVLRGGPGDDYLVSQGGRTVLDGGWGRDELVGGRGRDVMRGGPGADLIIGAGGRADRIDGGPGDDVCTADRRDRRSRCALDRRPPVVRGATLSVDRVDVTRGARVVDVVVRATDDAAVSSVGVDLVGRPGSPALSGGHVRRISGTARDGRWRFRLTVPGWAGPGVYDLRVHAFDRTHLDGRWHDVRYRDRPLEVVNANPDDERPVVEMLAPAPSAVVDSRRAWAEVPVRVRVTDARSGVGPDAVGVSIVEPRAPGREIRIRSGPLRRVSGTARDGIWSGSIGVPRGSIGGTWNLAVHAVDRAVQDVGPPVFWTTQEEYDLRRTTGWTDVRVLPRGRGSLTVLGRVRSDSTPPRPGSVSLSADRVVADRERRIDVTAGVLDPGSGVAEVYASLVPVEVPRPGSGEGATRLRLESGSIRDGRWVGQLWVRPRTPPGTYWLHLEVVDRDGNRRTWVPQDSPHHPDHGSPYAGLPRLVVLPAG